MSDPTQRQHARGRRPGPLGHDPVRGRQLRQRRVGGGPQHREVERQHLVGARRRRSRSASTSTPRTTAMTSRSPAGQVNALAVSGSNVYVGGAFNLAGGKLISGLAVWNGIGWSSLGTGGSVVDGSSLGSVNSIAVNGSTVYVGGHVRPRRGHAQLHRRRGPAGNGGGQHRAVDRERVEGAGQRRQQLQRLRLGHRLLGRVLERPRVHVRQLLRRRRRRTAEHRPVERRDMDADRTQPGWCAVDADRHAGRRAGGGRLRNTADGSVTLNSLGLWNGTAWSGYGLGLSYGSNAGSDARRRGGQPHACMPAGTSRPPARRRRRNLAVLNGGKWSTVGGGLSGGGATPDAILISGSDVYVGGDFTQAGTTAASHIARWDGSGMACPRQRRRRDRVRPGHVQRQAVGGRELRPRRDRCRLGRRDLGSRRIRRGRRSAAACTSTGRCTRWPDGRPPTTTTW